MVGVGSRHLNYLHRGRHQRVPPPTTCIPHWNLGCPDTYMASLNSIYLLRFWGDMVPHQSAPATDGPPLPAAALLRKLLPGRPDLVDDAVRSVREGRPWKKVGITKDTLAAMDIRPENFGRLGLREFRLNPVLTWPYINPLLLDCPEVPSLAVTCPPPHLP